MVTGFLSRLFSRFFAGSLVREAYAGILGREPDAIGLAAHTALVRRSGCLSPVLRTMAQSDEATGGQAAALARLAEHDPAECLKALGLPVLTQAYWGILGRAPDDEGLAAYAASLQKTGDLAALLREIAHSDEAWSQALQARAKAIAGELRAALHSDAEPATDTGEQLPPLRTTRDLRDLVQFLSAAGRPGNGAVHAPQSQARLPGAGPGIYAAQLPDPEGLVIAAFQGLLGRGPGPEALSHYAAQLRSTGDVVGFLAELGESVEHRRRVVLRRISQA
jgi:hypothetical protein